MMKRFVFLAYVLLLIVNISFGQEFYFERISSLEGENNLSVRKLVQDEKGIIWIATFSGLYRYDGGEFIVKHHFADNQQINVDVTSLLLAGHILWIGTDKGLSKYDLKTEKLITFCSLKDRKGSLLSDRIRSLALGNKGEIWVGTRDAGLNIYNQHDNTFSQIKFDSLNVSYPTHIKTIFVQNDSVLWLGTLYDGLYRLSMRGTRIEEAINYRNEDAVNFLKSNDVHSISLSDENEIIVGTYNGLFVYQPTINSFREIRSSNLNQSLPTNYYKTIYKDKDRNYWIGTYEGMYFSQSIESFEKGDCQFVRHVQSLNHTLSHNQVLDVFQDQSGVIWIGTESGLNKYDPYQNQFQPLTGENFNRLKEQSATAFLSYRQGLLILTHSDGVLFKKGNSITSFSPSLNWNHEFKNEKFYSMFVDSDKNVWLGSYSGLLVKLDNNGFLLSKFRISKENTPVYSIAELNDDFLLVGTGSFQGGLLKFNKKTSDMVHANDLLSNIQINKIHIDNNENIWLATQRGIFLKRKNKETYDVFLPDNTDSVISPNIFNDFAESSSGELFVAGRNGLYQYKSIENKFVNVELNSVSNLWVTDLQFDSNGVLWLNLNFNRIASWDIKTDKVLLFNVNNGVRSTPVNHRGFFIDNNNELFFSGFDQIYYSSINELEINAFTPPPVFTKLIVNNTEVRAGYEFNNQVVLDSQLSYVNKLTLNHKNRDFTLSFTSLSFSFPRNNKYRYILHGFDKEWTIGHNKEVQYPDLKPGNYVFEVFSANSFGFWSNQSLVLPIKIKPSPFLSLWAIALYLVTALFLAYQIHRIVIARINLRRELLIEKVKREKEEAFHQERLRFYTNISHELRTPLTLIMGPIKQLIDTETDNVGYIKLFHLIHDNSKRLLSLVNQLLDFRKSLFEGANLRVTHLNLREMIESNIQAFEYMAKDKSIIVEFESDVNAIHGWFDLDKLDSILFNILSNAFKYTPNNGAVNICLKTGIFINNKKCTKISVKNSGKGIPKHQQDKVFERFYKINDDAYNSTGSGIGLALVKNLVENHRGKIELESEPNLYTCFTVVLPIEKEAYADNEIFDFSRDADRRTKELILNKIDNQTCNIVNTENVLSIKVLLIDDNIELRDFLHDYLKAEFIILVASDGLSGLEICQSEFPDLIISDIMMDKMSGIEFCKKLRSTPQISHIPVILMTALAAAENKIDGYKNGADDYITKPFEPELLKIRIKNLLEGRKRIKQSFVQNLNISVKELTVSQIDEDFIGKFINVIEKNIRQECLEVDFLCKELGVSSSHLYRKIKAISGLSPIEFVNNYRLKIAVQLLMNTKLNISEIAYEVGYGNPNYFSRIFKKQYNLSPSQYREIV